MANYNLIFRLCLFNSLWIRGCYSNISPIAFLVDRCENVYISGWGGHLGGNNNYGSAGTFGLPVTPDAFKSVTDGKDFYFFVLKKDATSQLFGSFLVKIIRPSRCRSCRWRHKPV